VSAALPVATAPAPVLFEVAHGIARITLHRPDKLNSFTAQMHAALRDALDRVETQPGIRVLLLTGAGRAFCAGQDLADRAVAPGAAPVDLGASVERDYAPLVRRLRALPMPVVCAVNGVAAGAGANVALACDLVVAKASARFLQPFCRLGLVPDTGGTWFLPRLVGSARALGLALLGDAIGAQQAADWGLIWRCVDDDAFDTEVEALLSRLATAPTRGLACTKQALHASLQADLDTQLDRERDLIRALGASDDYREGVAAFLAKREPRFHGR
jgi:2-(1,2-epoxy-1,2-dihydrophenyl)acetyl-CoA isomerase